MKRLFYCKGFLFLFLLNCLQADKSAFDFSTPAGGIFFISGILSSVNSSGSGSSVSSPTITYSSGTSYNFFAGSAISPISPTLTGTVIGCSVSPSLPAGLSISSGCVISGTASSWSASTIYTITATASGGTASVSITLRVQSSTAVRVYGQLGSFTSSTANNGGSPSANNLTNAFGYTAADSGGNLYVADYQNNRVLYYPSGSTTATRVYGQAGSFTSSASGTSATALFYPSGIAVDSAGNLYAAEASNHRVLYFPSGSTTATRVYGQNGSYTCTAGAQNNNGSCVSGTPSANNLNNPYGIALDSADNLYVADSGNHRVLYYPSGSTTATRVYGQLGSFTSNTANNGGSPSANNLTNPSGAAVDSSGNLYITDRGNSRVLYYPSGSTTATRVYGQLGSFTSNTVNNGGASANTLNNPLGITLDKTGNLYVADYYNNRVLYYIPGSTTASRVYGQFGSFTSTVGGNDGNGSTLAPSASNLYYPTSVSIDPSGNLYIAEQVDNRVLLFY